MGLTLYTFLLIISDIVHSDYAAIDDLAGEKNFQIFDYEDSININIWINK